MALVRWNPTREMMRGDRVFDEMMRRMWGDDNGEVVQTMWAPRVDIDETNNDYVVTADLPGMKREDIDVTIENGELRISGERKTEREEKEGTARVRERAYGSFVRTFNIGNNVDVEKIRANFKDGVLELTLPKAEQKKPKKIKIES